MKAERPNTRYAIHPIALIALLAFASGCASNTLAPSAFGTSAQIDFDDADGRTALRLEPDGNSIRVEGPKGRLIATVRENSDVLRVDDAAGESKWIIQKIPGERLHLRVRSAPSNRIAFELKEEPDGDLDIDDGNGNRIATAKQRSYGYKLVSSEGNTLARVRLRSGKISVRDHTGLTYLTTRDSISTRAVALLALETLPVEAASGLGVATAFWAGNPSPGESTSP